MGKPSRAKGRRGQTAFANLLKERDWTVADLSAGASSEDLLAVDPDGTTWAVEVKNTVAMTSAHVKQAIEQGKKRKARWMLANKIAGTSSWLIRRMGEKPSVWHEREEKINVITIVNVQ